MPLKGERMQREPPSNDGSQRLAEALLASTMQKRKQSLLIQFDDLSDSNTAYRVLLQMRDGYEPRGNERRLDCQPADRGVSPTLCARRMAGAAPSP